MYCIPAMVQGSYAELLVLGLVLLEMSQSSSDTWHLCSHVCSLNCLLTTAELNVVRDQQPLVPYITVPQRNTGITVSRYGTKSYALKALKMFDT